MIFDWMHKTCEKRIRLLEQHIHNLKASLEVEKTNKTFEINRLQNLIEERDVFISKIQEKKNLKKRSAVKDESRS